MSDAQQGGAAPGGAPRGSILARTARGAGWVIAWRMLTRILGFGSTLVLVRLLSPADFGLVAVATAFATSLEVCMDLGVEDQIIRTHHPTPALYHTAFTLNLIRAITVGGLVVALAGPATSFFDDPRLGPVLVALGLLTMVSGLASIGTVDFRRELVFEKEFKLLLLPRLLSIAVTIAAAFIIPGHWALVLGIGVGRIARVVVGYMMHPYRPRLTLTAWRELASVSVWAWAIGVVGVMRDRCDTFIIGRMLGPAKVGVFTAGVEIAILPSTELVDPICRACMPGFAASVREGVNVAATYRRIIGLTALFALPAGVGISLVSADIVLVAFGPNWMEAVPVVAMIGLAAATTSFGNISQALLGSQTQLRSIFGVIAVTMVLRVGLLLALTRPYGLVGAAAGSAAVLLVEQVILVGLTLRRLKLHVRDLLPQVWRPLAGAVAMALLLATLGLGWAPAPTTAAEATRDLLVAVPLGAACYLGSVTLLWLAAGRPEGSAEHDTLALVAKGVGALLARLRGAQAGKLEAGKG